MNLEERVLALHFFLRGSRIVDISEMTGVPSDHLAPFIRKCGWPDKQLLRLRLDLMREAAAGAIKDKYPLVKGYTSRVWVKEMIELRIPTDLYPELLNLSKRTILEALKDLDEIALAEDFRKTVYAEEEDRLRIARKARNARRLRASRLRNREAPMAGVEE